MRELLVRAACGALRGYFRYCPIAAGKTTVWDRIVRPYLAWRDYEFATLTRFGAVFQTRLGDLIQSHIYFYGIWEPTISAYIESMLAPGDVVIDIGANVGHHTLLAALRVGATGRVFAIEASPATFGHLQHHLKINRAHHVVAINAAVMDQPGEVILYRHDKGNIGASTVIASEAAQRPTSVEAIVRAAPLGDLVPTEALRQARLIKIDVEGAEWPVLRGIADLLPSLSDRCQILIELNAAALSGFGAAVEDVLEVFRGAGFAPYEIANRYDPDFYSRPEPPILRPVTGLFRQADLVFQRPTRVVAPPTPS